MKKRCLEASSSVISTVHFYGYLGIVNTDRSSVTTVSQLKICDFLEEILKVLKCYNFLSVR